MKKENILISACLLGTPCRYDGKSNKIENLKMLQERYTLIPVCPEVFGGLSTPRTPAEIKNNAVITKEGKDVTSFFEKGAKICLDIAEKKQIYFAILKARSPSCGFGEIYDGSFSKKIIRGKGLTAALLEKHGYRIFTEIDLDKILKEDYNKIK